MAVNNPNIVKTADVAIAGRKPFSAEEKRKMVLAPGNVAAHRIVFIRRSVQIATFALFVLFFFLTTATSQHIGWVPKNLFMTLDFLNTLKNGIASHHVAIYAVGPGLFLLLLTLWGWRLFFCWFFMLGPDIVFAD